MSWLCVNLATLNYSSQSSLSCMFLAKVSLREILPCDLGAETKQPPSCSSHILICWLTSLLWGSRQASNCPTFPGSSSNFDFYSMMKLTIFSYSIPTTSKSEAIRTDIVSAHPCGFQLMLMDPVCPCSFPLLRIESCPYPTPKKDVLKSLSPGPQNVILFGNGSLQR